MSKGVILFGNGDFARIASVYLEHDSPREVVAFTVHEAYRKDSTLLGKPVVPFEKLTQDYPPTDFDMFVAMGFRKVNKLRSDVYYECKARGYSLITFIHSKAVVCGPVEFGDNVFIFENNVVQPFVKIGSDTIIWSGNHIGHDSVIGSHCFITSHVVISGNARLGDYCFVGINSSIRDGVTVGEESVIGAGSLILGDAAPRSVFQGAATEVSKVPSNRLRSL